MNFILHLLKFIGRDFERRSLLVFDKRILEPKIFRIQGIFFNSNVMAEMKSKVGPKINVELGFEVWFGLNEVNHEETILWSW